jgi:hypothetical protein
LRKRSPEGMASCSAYDVQALGGNRSNICHVSLFPDQAISRTGLHYGFLHNGKVYDNLHHTGVDRDTWTRSFVFFNARTGHETTVTTEYVSEMSGAAFLSRQK